MKRHERRKKEIQDDEKRREKVEKYRAKIEEMKSEGKQERKMEKDERNVEMVRLYEEGESNEDGSIKKLSFNTIGGRFGISQVAVKNIYDKAMKEREKKKQEDSLPKMKGAEERVPDND